MAEISDPAFAAFRRDWLSPVILVTLLGSVGTAYGAFMVQRARIDAVERRLTQVEADYQRREVVVIELKAIHQQLEAIQRALDARASRP